MHRVIPILALLVAACAPEPQAAAFRNTETPIWSAAAFEPGLIEGTWQQVAAFQPAGGGCDGGAVAIRPAAGGLAVQGQLCLAGGMQNVSGLMQPAGPGRLALPGQEDWWVLWVDSGYRTLAIGTPSGRFGLVLDRGAIPPDRLEAAREIFDFNGYAAAGLTAL